MRRDRVIKIGELPMRTRGLELHEMQNVFGGCLGSGFLCASDSDCCANRCMNAYDQFANDGSRSNIRKECDYVKQGQKSKGGW